MKWNDLPMAERAKYIQLGVKNGITNLYEIKNYYNSFVKDRNQFNPEGIIGDTWIDNNNYQLSPSKFNSDWDTDATIDYFNSAEDSPVNLYAPDGANMLKGITVTPNNKFGGGGKKNYRIARLNNSGKPVIDYSIPAFNSEEEMDSYIKNNNLQQVFVE